MIHFWKKKIANTRNSVTNEASLQGNIFIQTRQEYYTKKQKKKKKNSTVFSPHRECCGIILIIKVDQSTPQSVRPLSVDRPLIWALRPTELLLLPALIQN